MSDINAGMKRSGEIIIAVQLEAGDAFKQTRCCPPWGFCGPFCCTWPDVQQGPQKVRRWVFRVRGGVLEEGGRGEGEVFMGGGVRGWEEEVFFFCRWRRWCFFVGDEIFIR